MKIVHFTIDDGRSGAVRSAFRLHHALLSLKVDSKVLVRHKISDDPTVIEATAAKTDPLFEIVHDYYIKFQRTLLTNTLFSLGYPGTPCHEEKIVGEADLLVLHWVADFLSPAGIASLLSLGKPLVWVCHDMRAFTGGCHYTAGCRQFTEICQACPQLKSDPFGVVEANFRDQLEAFNRQPITVVAPSQWMAREARSSAIFGKSRIETIPYGLDIDLFAPGNKKEARLELGLAPDAFLILLACSDAHEERKGLRRLEAITRSLSELPEMASRHREQKIQLLFVGQNTESLSGLQFPAKHLGFLREDEEVRRAYLAADVLLHLSLEDNLPNMVLEAMACGIPVAGFDAGGASDMISHEKNGLLAPAGNVEALSAALLGLILDPARRDALGHAARRLIETQFAPRQQAEAHLALYKDLIKQSRPHQAARAVPLSSRMEKIAPGLVAIAESVERLIQREKKSASDQLDALAQQNWVETQKLEIKMNRYREALKQAERTPYNRVKKNIKKGLKALRNPGKDKKSNP